MEKREGEQEGKKERKEEMRMDVIGQDGGRAVERGCRWTIVRISELTLPPGEHFGPLNDVG